MADRKSFKPDIRVGTRSGTGVSALYRGEVRHLRLRPRRHELRYSVFMLLLELDQLEAITRSLRLFSVDRRNVLSLHQPDHGNGSSTPLRAQIAARLQDSGLGWDGGPVRMLFMPRVLGYGFNPLTVYYCYQHDDRLAAVLYEVHNTFGERHFYLLPVTGAGEPFRQQIDKRFYVSPFLGMEMDYHFEVWLPNKVLRLAIRGEDDTGTLIATSFLARRHPLNDRELLKALLAFPFLGLKVWGGIHLEAFKLWRKGIALNTRPEPPHEDLTLGAWPRPVGHSPEGPHPGA